jgi:dCMP deaminase
MCLYRQMDLNNIIEIESSVIMSQFIKCASKILVTEKDSGSLLEWMHKEMARLEPTFREAVRPSWNKYFMEMAHLASQRSNCMKRRVGAVLVSVQSHHILSTGYNGTPRGIPNCCEGGCARCNSNKGAGLDLTSCICLHAEENALLEVGSERISKNKKGGGVVLYCTTCPCLGCAKKMIQCGVSSVYYAHNYHMDDRVHSLFKQANVNCIQFDI